MNEWMERLSAWTEGLLGFDRKENILSLRQKTERRVPTYNMKQLIKLVE